MPATDDRPARDRIRDAAITRFARDGFGVPLRVIAADAGVSAALVIHHFGSKDGLRAACDQYVLEDSFLLKSGVIENADPALLRRLMGNLGAFGEPIAYVLRAILEGGEIARSILERTAEAAEFYLEAGVASGVVRPSRDPAGRARYLTYTSLGMLVTAFLGAGPPPASAVGPQHAPDDDATSSGATAGGDPDPYAHVTDLLAALTIPHLELMSHGLLADDALLRSAEDWVADAAPASTTPTTRREP